MTFIRLTAREEVITLRRDSFITISGNLVTVTVIIIVIARPRAMRRDAERSIGIVESVGGSRLAGESSNPPILAWPMVVVRRCVAFYLNRAMRF